MVNVNFPRSVLAVGYDSVALAVTRGVAVVCVSFITLDYYFQGLYITRDNLDGAIRIK